MRAEYSACTRASQSRKRSLAFPNSVSSRGYAQAESDRAVLPRELGLFLDARTSETESDDEEFATIHDSEEASNMWVALAPGIPYLSLFAVAMLCGLIQI